MAEFQHTAARRRLGPVKAASRGFCWFQHTAARRRLTLMPVLRSRRLPFQHTAARRRLVVGAGAVAPNAVSTHSRPKAAEPHFMAQQSGLVFQHTAARRRLLYRLQRSATACRFQHTAARRRLFSNFSTFSASSCFNTQPPEGG